MLITVVSVLVALVAGLLLTFAGFARTDAWRATVTPLASIIGSGFLICGPLMARAYGAAALPAMALLLALAYALGAVVRFNIVHVEAHAAGAPFHDPIAWMIRLTQGVLSMAYAVSVTYYLKLLAEFILGTWPVATAWHALTANLIVSALIAVLAGLGLSGGLRRVEHLAHGSVSVKLGAIAGLMTGLAGYWLAHPATPALPTARLGPEGLPVLLGLLITVQGFETSRYLGASYTGDLRIRTMRRAQWISSAIYLLFLALLTPVLGRAGEAPGVAGVIGVVAPLAAPMVAFVLVAAVASQLSAAVADSIGSAGLMSELTRRRLGLPAALLVACALALAVVWLTDPLQVVALASRAFALFYACQCVLALLVVRRAGAAGLLQRLGFACLGLACVAASLVAAPAE